MDIRNAGSPDIVKHGRRLLKNDTVAALILGLVETLVGVVEDGFQRLADGCCEADGYRGIDAIAVNGQRVRRDGFAKPVENLATVGLGHTGRQNAKLFTAQKGDHIR